MKKIIFGLILTFSTDLYAQDYFKGIISYTLEIEVNDPQFSKSEFENQFGNGSTFYFEKGNYLQIYHGGMMEFDYLNHSEKKYYMKFLDSDTIFITDATKNTTMDLIALEKKPVEEKVLDYTCRRIDLYAKNLIYGFDYEMSFYYSKQIVINEDNFAGLKYAFADLIYGNIASIPLKFDMRNPILTINSTATSIREADDFSVVDMFSEKAKGMVFKELD